MFPSKKDEKLTPTIHDATTDQCGPAPANEPATARNSVWQSLALRTSNVRRTGSDLGPLQGPMERAYDSDFSSVRIHTDSVADR